MNLLSRRTTRWIAGAFVVLCVLAGIPQWSGGQQPFGGQQFAKQTKTYNPIEGQLPKNWAMAFKWRDIGPATMGGRVTAIAVYEPDPSIYYVATGGGGLLKTENNGVTFKHQFDKETTVAIGDVAVSQTNPNIVWVGTGENNPRNSVSYGDGVYKSVDGGEKWQNMGLKQSFQIGKILIHPTNPDIVYVGALGRLYGPNSERGVFKTTDGGKTWNKVFYLDDKTGVIDMRMHPKDPDTIIVAMWERMRDGFDSYLGPDRPEHINVYDPIVKWGANAGLYKTTDGFKTPPKKLSKGLPSNKMGRIGLDWYLKDPNIVYAIIDCEKIGMGTPPKQVASNAYLGIFGEDADNGAKLTRVVDDGPAGKAGLKVDDIVLKIGDKAVKSYEELIEEVGNHKVGAKVKLQVQRGTGMQVFEVTLEDRTALQGFQGKGGGFGPGGGTKDRPYHAYYGGQKENVQDRQGPNSHEYGGIYMSKDAGESWTRVNSLNSRPMYFSVIRVDPSDNKHLVAAGVSMHFSSDGGKTFRSTSKGVHADHHAWWINPKNGKHQIIGSDGGFYVTYDRGRSWDHLNHLALGQFYHVAVSTKQPYWVYGGLQDNGTWGGPSNTRRATGPINEDWVSVGGGDGFMCRVDPNDPDLVYGTSQDGNIYRRNLRTGERVSIRPIPPGAGKGKKGGKGAPQEKQPMQTKDPKAAPSPYRFNWNTPYILSSFNSKIFYSAGNFVFKSLDRGNDLRIISPEITLTKRGSATALAESPKNPEVLWVGTDDGAIWITRNGGKDWSNVTSKVGLKGPRWVANIEASRFEEGRAYVAFDAHRSDDDEPYLYVTEDFGQTWKSIRGNLPVGSTRCLREDVENPNLLYCGTEFAFFVSLNRGKDWTKLNNNLPTVAVHEIAVHPTAGEIVAATHGRSLWILDVSGLRQITADTMKDLPHLYKPHTAIRWQNEPSRGGTNRRYVGKNPDDGANIYYSLAKKADKVSLQVMDVEGAVLARLNGSNEPGLHKLNWNLTRTLTGGQGPQGTGGRFGGKGKGGFQGKAAEAKAGEPKGADPKATAQAKGGGFQGKGPAGGGFRASVPTGTYKLVLTVDGQQYTSTIRVEADPNAPTAIGITQENEEKIVID